MEGLGRGFECGRKGLICSILPLGLVVVLEDVVSCMESGNSSNSKGGRANGESTRCSGELKILWEMISCLLDQREVEFLL